MKRLSLLVLLLSTLLFAQAWDGVSVDSTWYTKDKAATEFTISTAAQLAGLAAIVNGNQGTPFNFSGRVINLAVDIDLNWKPWTPIGNRSRPFQGTFDGRGKFISGLSVSDVTYAGLFGFGNAKIRNVGVSGTVSGSYSGGLLGYANGGVTITNSYFTGDVSGVIAGGLVGENSYVTDCYFIGDVSGSSMSGGLVGSSGNITNSYSIGDVSAAEYFGGLLGYTNFTNPVRSSYYNRETSDKADNSKGTPKTTAQMKIQNSYEGWNFTDIWVIDPTINNGFPALRSMLESQRNLLTVPEISIANQRLKYGSLPTIIERYTGSPITPTIESVSLNGRSLENTDYEVTYSNNVEISTAAAPAKITIKGKGEYGGTSSFKFYILPDSSRSIATTGTTGVTIDAIPEQLWDGTNSQITPKPILKTTISGFSITLRENADYTLSYINNTNEGMATITIAGAGIFTGQRTVHFGIAGTLYKATISNIDSVTYIGSILEPKITVTHNTSGVLTEGIDYTVSYSNNINAGAGLVSVTGIGSHTGTISRTFTINKATVNSCSVTMPNFIASGTPSNPVPSSTTHDIIKVKYEYESVGNNSWSKQTSKPSNAGTYEVTATFEAMPNYNECISTAKFTIAEGDATFIDITWSTSCDTTFTYNGAMQSPQPTHADYQLSLSGIGTNANSYTATATLATPNSKVVINNPNCPYTIAPKELPVTWTTDSVFTYNKMDQAPVPSVTEPSVELLRINAKAVVGIYKEQNAVFAEIKDQAQARNYNLTNRTKNYEILKKDLNPYFTANLPSFEINTAKDTLKVPTEVFTDMDALKTILANIIAYDGFATDTTKTIYETDNESVFKGKTPTIEFTYAPTSPALSKRVETTQKATATIVTDEILPDNYSLTRPVITIIEIIDDEAEEPIFCQRDAYCTELNAEICSFIGGKATRTCDAIRASCIIDESYCVANMLQAACTNIGGSPTTQSCAMMSPIMPHIPFSISHASSYYNLKGLPLGMQKPTIPGVYIEKAGKQARKILVK